MVRSNGINVKDAALFAAFKAGFLASGEGWNGEYPFRHPGHEYNDNEKSEQAFREMFMEWMSKQ